MDLFMQREFAPMLIAEERTAFDDPDWIFELKLDGERGVAYLDPKAGTDLRNKRNKKMLPAFPELSELHRQAKAACILDGEYVVLQDGKPDFEEVRRRSIMTNPLKIRLASQKAPVIFVAYDILWLKGELLTTQPLLKRKEYLQKSVKEGANLAISRYVEGQGITLYALAAQQGLEGVVAKRKDSLYYQGKRTKDWVKSKVMMDDDFVCCGYIRKSGGMNSIVLGQYRNGELIYKGHVTLGAKGKDFRKLTNQQKLQRPPFASLPPAGNENAVWIQPELVCKVEFMKRTSSGGMRQPVFKGIRDDKNPRECMEH